MNQTTAEEMWNVATGGGTDSPATAFAGVAAGHGAPKYIPILRKDFTAGNNTPERHDARDFLLAWADALLGVSPMRQGR